MKDYSISLLADFYANCLSERSLQIVRWYYDEDLSLKEIADLLGISRQGVSDYLSKATALLKDLEAKLKMRENCEKANTKIDDYISVIKLCEPDKNTIIEMLLDLKN